MSEDSKTLWCIEVVGPDDWHAAKSAYARQRNGGQAEKILNSTPSTEDES